jgi:hypothetical protein
MNYAVRQILAGTPYLKSSYVVAWATLSMRNGLGFEDHVKLQAASQLSKEFARHIVEQRAADIRYHDEPLGQVLEMTAYAMTREQLLSLLEQAYTEGRAAGREMPPSFMSAAEPPARMDGHNA